MNKSQSEKLIARLIDRVTTNSSDSSDASLIEQASFFLSLDRWQNERDAFFFQTPQVIGFSGELQAPNSYLTTESMGVPIVAIRDADGSLRAFVNACAHRGARVASGSGVSRRLNCGFHGWSYNLDGSLAGRPQEAHFCRPKAQCGLVPLPISDRSGLLVVGLKPDIPKARVDNALDDIADQFAGFNFEHVHSLQSCRFEVAANWKLVVSLSLESYHFPTLHRDSLAPMMTSHSVVDEFGMHTRWSFPFRGIEKMADEPRETWPLRPPAVVSHTIFPGTMIIVGPVDAQIIRVEPGADVGASVVYFSGVCDDLDRIEESLDGFEFGRKIFATEDLPVAEQCQQGIASGLASIEIGANEPAVQMWHHRWHKYLL